MGSRCADHELSEGEDSPPIHWLCISPSLFHPHNVPVNSGAAGWACLWWLEDPPEDAARGILGEPEMAGSGLGVESGE